MSALDRLISRLTPELAAALLASLQDMRDGVDYPALLAAIDAVDPDAVERALNIEDASFAPYIAAAMVIYMRSGAEMAREIARGGRFNPALDAEFRRDLADKVAARTAEQIEAARARVYEGLASGRTRREIAESLAGRISKATGKRTGGVTGLSRPQQSWVDTMRERLASGDAAQLRATLAAKDRDKRYDRTIKVAIRDGKVIPPAKIDEITGKYADRLLRKRATNIASVEVEQFAANAREDAVRQALAKMPGAVARKTWHHSSIYINARPDHVGMSGVTVDMEANFVMADGTAMRYAHDPRGGARHSLNCRCRTTYAISRPVG